MKEYAVRLIDYAENVVDGLIVEANNEEEAKSLYIIQHSTAFADMYPTDKLVISQIHYIPHSYPKYESNQAFVITHTETGKMQKAMFYWNGGKPTFASYGSDITDSVVSWEYDSAHYARYGKDIPQ